MSKTIEVDLNRQVLIAKDAGVAAFTFDCVSGDDAHPTPVGTWKVNAKHATYTSKKYHVRMDYAMFFTRTGEAIHKSHAVVPLSYLKYFGITYFGSHGCVRLAAEDASALFTWTPMGTPVWVH